MSGCASASQVSARTGRSSRFSSSANTSDAANSSLTESDISGLLNSAAEDSGRHLLALHSKASRSVPEVDTVDTAKVAGESSLLTKPSKWVSSLGSADCLDVASRSLAVVLCGTASSRLAPLWWQAGIGQQRPTRQAGPCQIQSILQRLPVHFVPFLFFDHRSLSQVRTDGKKNVALQRAGGYTLLTCQVADDLLDLAKHAFLPFPAWDR